MPVCLWDFFLSVAPDAVAYCHKSRRWEGGHRQVGRQKATTEYVFWETKMTERNFCFFKKDLYLFAFFWNEFWGTYCHIFELVKLWTRLWISTGTQRFWSEVSAAAASRADRTAARMAEPAAAAAGHLRRPQHHKNRCVCGVASISGFGE